MYYFISFLFSAEISVVITVTHMRPPKTQSRNNLSVIAQLVSLNRQGDFRAWAAFLLLPAWSNAHSINKFSKTGKIIPGDNLL